MPGQGRQAVGRPRADVEAGRGRVVAEGEARRGGLAGVVGATAAERGRGRGRTGIGLGARAGGDTRERGAGEGDRDGVVVPAVGVGGAVGLGCRRGLEVSTWSGKLMDRRAARPPRSPRTTAASPGPSRTSSSQHPDGDRGTGSTIAQPQSPGSCTTPNCMAVSVSPAQTHVTDSVFSAGPRRRRSRRRDRHHRRNATDLRPHAADPMISRCNRLAIRPNHRLAATSTSSTSAPTRSTTPWLWLDAGRAVA